MATGYVYPHDEYMKTSDTRPLLLFDLFSIAAFVASGLLLLHAATLTVQPLSGGRSAPGDTPAAPNIATSSDASLNWSGYVAQGGVYTAVSGTWVVPRVSASSNGLVADATWVGIGGVMNEDLIQAGTQTVGDGEGNLLYEAWYEVMPDDSQAVAMTVSPGDTVTVSLSQTTPGHWYIAFDDKTSGATYATEVAYDSSLSSAEWIEEMPSSGAGNHFIPLDNFGSVQFLNGSATKDGQSQTLQALGAQPLSMLSLTDQTLAYPSTLGPDGASFTVSRTSAPAASVLSHRRHGY